MERDAIIVTWRRAEFLDYQSRDVLLFEAPS